MANELTLLNRESWDALREQCGALVKSGFLPKGVDTPEKAIAIALKGHEMGLGIMSAFGGISIVNGKPVVEGQLMLSQIRRLVPGAKIEFLERTEKICRIRATRPGEEPCEFSWTIEQAKSAGLTAKPGPWQSYPRNMLQWRAVSDMARAMFPDAVMGAYLQDEIDASVVDVTPKSENVKSLQDLLSAPAPSKAEAPLFVGNPLGVDLNALASPSAVDAMFKAFEALNYPREAVLEAVMVPDASKITEADMAELRKWFDEEHTKAKKAQK